jgi:hypothetical protein
MLFLSKGRAADAALHAIHYEGRADRFLLRHTTQRQPDGSAERGWVVLLFRRGRFLYCLKPAN